MAQLPGVWLSHVWGKAAREVVHKHTNDCPTFSRGVHNKLKVNNTPTHVHMSNLTSGHVVQHCPLQVPSASLCIVIVAECHGIDLAQLRCRQGKHIAAAPLKCALRVVKGSQRHALRQGIGIFFVAAPLKCSARGSGKAIMGS